MPLAACLVGLRPDNRVTVDKHKRDPLRRQKPVGTDNCALGSLRCPGSTWSILFSYLPFNRGGCLIILNLPSPLASSTRRLMISCRGSRWDNAAFSYPKFSLHRTRTDRQSTILKSSH